MDPFIFCFVFQRIRKVELPIRLPNLFAVSMRRVTQTTAMQKTIVICVLTDVAYNSFPGTDSIFTGLPRVLGSTVPWLCVHLGYSDGLPFWRKKFQLGLHNVLNALHNRLFYLYIFKKTTATNVYEGASRVANNT